MNENIALQDVHNRIYRIRGQQVMLDSDLAILYGESTKRLNQQMRRNLSRFPPDFMFQLSATEIQALRLQSATLEKGAGRGRYRKYRPFAFTEHGIAMLSSVLRSEQAIQVNIAIIRTFIKLRHALAQNRELTRRVEKIEGRLEMHETDIRLMIKDVEELKQPPERPGPPSDVI